MSLRTSNKSQKSKAVLTVAVFLVLPLCATMAQEKPITNYSILGKGKSISNQLKLATSLGVTDIHYSAFPLFHYSMVDSGETTYTPSLHYSDTAAVDTSTAIIKQKSALTAVLLSVVIPGGGQIYNGSYWKVPIIYGLQAFFVTQWISNNKTYQSFRTQYDDSLKAGANSYYLLQLQQDRDAFHDQRDSYAWYIAGVYVLSMLDAYVDAELSGFDVSPKLGVAPDGSASVAVSVRVKF